jgi:hypothetical protein
MDDTTSMSNETEELKMDRFAVVVNGAVWKVWDGPSAEVRAREQATRLTDNGRGGNGLCERWIQGFNEALQSAVVRLPNKVTIKRLVGDPRPYESGETVFSWTETLPETLPTYNRAVQS